MSEDESTAVKGDSAPRSPHRFGVAALIVAASLLLFVGIFSVWVNRQVMNTDNWVQTSEKLLQNEEVRSQLANYVSNTVFENVDVEAKLQEALPAKLQPLLGPVVGGLEQLGPQVAEKALETSKVQQLWAEANRRAHERFLQVVDGGGPAISTENGEVTLDVGALAEGVSGRLGVGSKVAEVVPPGSAEITILKSDELSLAQSIVKLIRKLPIVLAIVVLLLYGLAIWLAGPRRREALRSIAVGFVVAGLLALIVRNLAGSAVVNALVENESVKPAAEAVWSIGTSLLVTAATSVLAFGILLFLGAWLAGPTAVATGLRREAAPYVRDQVAGMWLLAGLVFILLIAWAPIHALHTLLGIVLFALLFAAGTELLRRQMLAEFPPGAAHSESRIRSGGGLAEIFKRSPKGSGDSAP